MLVLLRFGVSLLGELRLDLVGVAGAAVGVELAGTLLLEEVQGLGLLLLAGGLEAGQGGFLWGAMALVGVTHVGYIDGRVVLLEVVFIGKLGVAEGSRGATGQLLTVH